MAIVDNKRQVVDEKQANAILNEIREYTTRAEQAAASAESAASMKTTVTEAIQAANKANEAAQNATDAANSAKDQIESVKETALDAQAAAEKAAADAATAAEKVQAALDSNLEQAIDLYSGHINDSSVHVTQAEKDYWNTISSVPGPKGEKGDTGPQGLSAYEVAVANGFTGTESSWLSDLQGPSAYELAVTHGYTGTESQWLASLVGPRGPQGLSAYEVAVNAGFSGSTSAWLASLKGEKGDTGLNGANGKDGVNGKDGESAYEAAVRLGLTTELSEESWLQSLQGLSAYEIAVQTGSITASTSPAEWIASLQGESAYQIAVSDGYAGTQDEWLDSLHGKSAFELAVENGLADPSMTEQEWLESLYRGGSAGGATADEVQNLLDTHKTQVATYSNLGHVRLGSSSVMSTTTTAPVGLDGNGRMRVIRAAADTYGAVKLITDMTSVTPATDAYATLSAWAVASRFSGLNSDLNSIYSGLSGKADADHTHTQADIAGLASSLNTLTNSVNNVAASNNTLEGQVNDLESQLSVTEANLSSRIDTVSTTATAAKTAADNAYSAITAHANDSSVHVTASQLAALSSFSNHINNTTVHVTAAERSAWNNKLDTSVYSAHVADIANAQDGVAGTGYHLVGADRDNLNGLMTNMTTVLNELSGESTDSALWEAVQSVSSSISLIWEVLNGTNTNYPIWTTINNKKDKEAQTTVSVTGTYTYRGGVNCKNNANNYAGNPRRITFYAIVESVGDTGYIAIYNNGSQVAYKAITSTMAIGSYPIQAEVSASSTVSVGYSTRQGKFTLQLTIATLKYTTVYV